MCVTHTVSSKLVVPVHSVGCSDFIALLLLNMPVFNTSVILIGQIDLETIKDMYLEKYDVSLKDAISSECGGDFKRLLLAICH